DAQMHLYFAGRAALPLGEHRAIQAHLDHHVLRHEALGHARGGGPDDVVIHLAADIAIVGGHKVLLIHPAADLHNQLFRLVIRWIAMDALHLLHLLLFFSIRTIPWRAAV